MGCAEGLTRRTMLSGLMGAVLVGCDDGQPQDYQPTYAIKSAAADKSYRFGCPFNSPETLFEIYQPLIDYVNQRLGGAILRLEASRDYDVFEQKLYYRNFDFALANPYQSLMAVANGYDVVARMGDDPPYRGLILVRRDSSIQQVTDLRGRAVSFPASSALATTMMTQAYLQDNGVDVSRDLDIRYTGSEESSILAVFLGRVAAGATWPLAWRRFQASEPAKAAQLMVKWETPPLPGNGVVARNDIPPELVRDLRAALLSLPGNDQGRAVLRHLMISEFIAADTATYQPVQAFLQRFNQTVRSVALP